MNTKNDGGPAYPVTRSVNAHGENVYLQDSCARIDSNGGMTMRQYYKAAALQGLLASGVLSTKPRQMEMGEMCDGIIATAGQFADALLSEDEQHAKE